MFAAVAFLLLVGQAWSQVPDQVLVPGGTGSNAVEFVSNLIRDSCLFKDDLLFLRRLAYVASHDGTDANTYRAGYDGGIWQIDQDKFNQIKSSATSTDLIGKVRSLFNIDWSTVQWSDLRKPLYSGLAAALYLSTITESLPQGVENQGSFYKKYFRDDPHSPHNFYTASKQLDSRTRSASSAAPVSCLDALSGRTAYLVLNPYTLTVSCPAGSVAYMPDTTDQTKFVLCRASLPTLFFQCLPHYIYSRDPNVNSCVRGEVVPPTTARPLVTEKPVPHPTMPDHSFNPCGNSDRDRIFYRAHPTDVHKYYHCDEVGNAFLKVCPDGKLWHQEYLQCLPQGLLIG
ncbi:uncharacterized protein [Haliotis cracherodii]|uniref:uncharacterized protein n=1 Tax=Haliotis cracherodii TaxID=6455 RepID=UPI0039EAECE3